MRRFLSKQIGVGQKTQWLVGQKVFSLREKTRLFKKARNSHEHWLETRFFHKDSSK